MQIFTKIDFSTLSRKIKCNKLFTIYTVAWYVQSKPTCTILSRVRLSLTLSSFAKELFRNMSLVIVLFIFPLTFYVSYILTDREQSFSRLAPVRLSVDTLLKVRDMGTLTLKESCCELPVRKLQTKCSYMYLNAYLNPSLVKKVIKEELRVKNLQPYVSEGNRRKK